jgi:hypothetical protein
MITLIGIDCATRSEKVGLARARWNPGGAPLEGLEFHAAASNANIPAAVKRWIAPTGLTLLALDAPLGWPAAFGHSLAAHQAGQPLEVENETFFRRQTDLEVAVLHRPMDVTADRIARTAYWALDLLGRVTAFPIPLAWDPYHLPPLSAIEVYPAATLLRMKLLVPGYKDAGKQDLRQQMIDGIAGRFAGPVDWSPCLKDADQLDAAVCLLAAADFLSNLSAPPQDLDLAKKEGWIWVRGT